MESSPVISNQVIEYGNLRTFTFAESLQIILSRELSSSAQPTGLGQGTELAMVEA